MGIFDDLVKRVMFETFVDKEKARREASAEKEREQRIRDSLSEHSRLHLKEERFEQQEEETEVDYLQRMLHHHGALDLWDRILAVGAQREQERAKEEHAETALALRDETAELRLQLKADFEQAKENVRPLVRKEMQAAIDKARKEAQNALSSAAAIAEHSQATFGRKLESHADFINDLPIPPDFQQMGEPGTAKWVAIVTHWFGRYKAWVTDRKSRHAQRTDFASDRTYLELPLLPSVRG